MKRHLWWFMIPPAAVLLLGLAPVHGAGMMTGTVTANAETAHYRLLLQIGPPEQMYSAAEAARTHPTSGEVMVTGAMTGMTMTGIPMTGMPKAGAMPMNWRHLEVHVIHKSTGTAIEYAAVRITVTNTATGKRVAVPVAQMYGVKEGFADWHYGNNVDMPPGAYTVVVVANGERATFHVTIPKM